MKFKTVFIILFNIILFFLAVFTGYSVIRYFAFFILAVIIVSFIMVNAAVFIIKFDQHITQSIIIKGMETEIMLEYVNKTFFIYPLVKLKYDDGRNNEITIYPGTHKYYAKIKPELKGVYVTGLEKIIITDLFDLFKYSKKIGINEKLYVMPCVKDHDFFDDGGSSEHINKETKINILENKNVISDLREYKYGDTLNRINWKATAKLGDVIVNNYENKFSPKTFIYVGGLTGEDEEDSLRIDDFGCEIAMTLINKIVKNNKRLSLLYNGKENIIDSDTVKSFEEYGMYLTQRSGEDTYENDLAIIENKILNTCEYSKVIFILKNVHGDVDKISKILKSNNIESDIYKIEKQNEMETFFTKLGSGKNERKKTNA